MTSTDVGMWCTWAMLALLVCEAARHEWSRRRYEAEYAKLRGWSDAIDACHRGLAELYAQLAERYPDDVHLQTCRDLFAAKYAQH